MLIHSFRVDIAKKYGVEESIFLYNISFWIAKNKANNKHFYEGTYWTYNSQKAFTELFPYMSRSKIQRLTTKLEDEGIIKTANFNKIGYDRTKWYSLTKKGEKLVEGSEQHNVQNEQSNVQNEQTIVQYEQSNVQNEQPIPYINTDTNTDKKPDKESNSGGGRGIPKEQVDNIITKWNELELAKIIKLSPSTERYKMLKQRIEEYDYTSVLVAIENIKYSSFLQGKNDRGWEITFDWLVRPNNFIKVLEEQYTDLDKPTILNKPKEEQEDTEGLDFATDEDGNIITF